MVGKGDEEVMPKKGYKWYEMGFFTHWDSLGHCRVLCIDTPTTLQFGLQTALNKLFPDPKDPFSMHVPLIDQVIKLYDRSIWLVRHPVRDIERVAIFFSIVT